MAAPGNLGTNLTKAVINLYSGNCKTVMKKSKRTQIDGEIYHVHGLEESI